MLEMIFSGMLDALAGVLDIALKVLSSLYIKLDPLEYSAAREPCNLLQRAS